jgi:hypothetical protein
VAIGNAWKARQQELREKRDGAVQPVPAANGQPQSVPSFMHSNQSSQQKADEAKRVASVPAANRDQSAKK